MRKLISILLLSIFVYYSIGFVFIFKLCQIYIKCEVKELIWEFSSDKEAGRVVLKFSEQQFAQINWIEDDEFFYNGNLYDAISQEKDRSGMTTVLCVNNSREMELYAQLEDHIKNHIDQHTPVEKNTKQMAKNKTSDYFYTHYSFEPILNPTSVYFESFSKKLVSFFPEKVSPPPKINC